MAIGVTSYHTNSDKARMRNEVRQQIVSKLSDKEYRDIFVSEQINTGLAFQIHAMREQRGWSQSQLGEKAGMAQSRISIMEDANYSRFSLNTLKRLASAFDVALVVRFEPYSKLVDHFVYLDSSSLNVPNFENDSFVSEVVVPDTFATIGSQLMGGTVWSGEWSGEHYNVDLTPVNFFYTKIPAVTQRIYTYVPFHFTNIQVPSQIEPLAA